MFIPLEDVTLTDGEVVSAAAIRGPDLEWAERIESLLGHKPPFWSWQNSAVVRRELGLDAHFHVLHRDGDPFAHVLTTEVEGVGLLGHVFTRPADRRKGAARLLMRRQWEFFEQRHGRCLILRTAHGGAPYRLYQELGFAGIEPGSGVMIRQTGGSSLETSWFAPGPTRIEPPTWRHWPASAPLFIADTSFVVRSVGRGLLGRAITEGPFLGLIREHGERAGRGETPLAQVLVHDRTHAVLGLAHQTPDPNWPGTVTVDIHCHPAFEADGSTLLERLELVEAERYVAYADVGWRWKEELLASAGYRRETVLPRWVARDARRSETVDVGVWIRDSSQP